MESNWRWNVFELGILGTGASLAARISGDPETFAIYVCNYNKEPHVYQQAFGSYATGFGMTSPVTTGIRNFPYGFTPLEPDH